MFQFNNAHFSYKDKVKLTKVSFNRKGLKIIKSFFDQKQVGVSC